MDAFVDSELVNIYNKMKDIKSQTSGVTCPQSDDSSPQASCPQDMRHVKDIPPLELILIHSNFLPVYPFVCCFFKFSKR